MIDAYLQSKAELDDHAIHLLFSANRWECVYVVYKSIPINNRRSSSCCRREAIRTDIEKGITIVADRYAFSGIAFSAAKVCYDLSSLVNQR